MRNSVLQYFIILFLLIPVVGNSQSADINSGNTQEVVLNSPLEKEAFENKSMGQIEDFYNYLNLVADPEIDSTLREHAMKMAKKTTVVQANAVNFLSDDHEPILLNDLLMLLLSENQKTAFSYKQIKNNGEHGNLEFTYLLNIKRGTISKELNIKHVFKVFLQEKTFGSKVLQVSDLKAINISLN